MIHVFAKIHVKDFALLEKFEHEAAKIMCEHKGKILLAFETLRLSDNSGEEIHILEFESEACFRNYRSNEKLQALSVLRAQAISSMDVKFPIELKSYR